MAERTDEREPILLGSAAAAWPEPDCRCRTCRGSWAPGVAPVAAPAGLQVGPVRVGGLGPGPVPVWFGEGPPGSIRSGDAVDRAGMRLIGLPAGRDEVALVLGIPGGPARTVLWSAGSGTLPESSVDALSGAELDVAVLAVGPAEGAIGLAHTLARLRAVDALSPGCDVVAVGFDHDLTPARLASCLAGWGVRIAPDGALLGLAHAVTPVAAPARTLLLGPASSGKSAVAESMLAAEPVVDYVPSSPPPSTDDPEWSARVQAHRSRRPPWWRTLESVDVVALLGTEGPPVLLDSLGAWVTELLGRVGAWDAAPGWQDRCETEIAALVRAWRGTQRQVIAVGEETGWGVVPGSSSGRIFRETLGRVARRLAAESDRVLLVAAGRLVPLDQEVPGV